MGCVGGVGTVRPAPPRKQPAAGRDCTPAGARLHRAVQRLVARRQLLLRQPVAPLVDVARVALWGGRCGVWAGCGGWERAGAGEQSLPAAAARRSTQPAAAARPASQPAHHQLVLVARHRRVQEALVAHVKVGARAAAPAVAALRGWGGAGRRGDPGVRGKPARPAAASAGCLESCSEAAAWVSAGKGTKSRHIEQGQAHRPEQHSPLAAPTWISLLQTLQVHEKAGACTGWGGGAAGAAVGTRWGDGRAPQRGASTAQHGAGDLGRAVWQAAGAHRGVVQVVENHHGRVLGAPQAIKLVVVALAQRQEGLQRGVPMRRACMCVLWMQGRGERRAGRWARCAARAGAGDPLRNLWRPQAAPTPTVRVPKNSFSISGTVSTVGGMICGAAEVDGKRR